MPVETFPGKCREVMRPNASGGTVAREIRASRLHPAVEEHVAASTQNVAFRMLRFL